jgi:putative glycosyltransferase
MKLSIVTTLYNSSRFIQEFYRRITTVSKNITADYEIIFVNDGSFDDSLRKACCIAEHDLKVRVIDLSRNYGHHKAMMVGLDHAQADYIFLTDVDLEERPENLSKFWLKIQEKDDVDIVYGIQDKKETPPLKKIFSRLFYSVFNTFSENKIKKNELVSRLMKRSCVEAIVSYKETSLFMPGIWHDIGFNQQPILTEKTFNGNSTYTLNKQLKLAVNAITSFSSFPLVCLFYIGTTISMISLAVAAVLIIKVIFFHQPIAGWTSIIVSIYLMGGLTILSLGIIGIYISKIFTEVKSRPYAIIKKIYRG